MAPNAPNVCAAKVALTAVAKALGRTVATYPVMREMFGPLERMGQGAHDARSGAAGRGLARGGVMPLAPPTSPGSNYVGLGGVGYPPSLYGMIA